jgi:hypothetical protein
MYERDTSKQEPAVKLRHTFFAVAASAALIWPATGSAADPELKLPDFTHLRNNAVDYTDITLDGFLLKIAKHFAARAEEEDEAIGILNTIKSVRVREFQFDSDDAYSRADIDAVRQQLSAPGWSPIIQQRTREPRSDVDVYLNTADGKIRGIAVIESEPRSFTIVNVVGNIDIDALARIGGEFGIPDVGPQTRTVE